MRSLLTLALFAAFSTAATAGPFRHRCGHAQPATTCHTAGSASPVSATAYRAPLTACGPAGCSLAGSPAYHTPPTFAVTPVTSAASSCSGGNCTLPTVRRGLFGR